MNKKSNIKLTRTQYIIIFAGMLIVMLMPSDVIAAGVTTGLDSLQNFISTIIKAIGVIIAAISMAFVGPGLSQHDITQVKMGLMMLVGGAIMAFHEQILSMMGM